MQTISLSGLPEGSTGILLDMNLSELFRKRLSDLGFTVGTTITCCHIAPSGSPMAFILKQSKIALRAADCASILIRINV